METRGRRVDADKILKALGTSVSDCARLEIQSIGSFDIWTLDGPAVGQVLAVHHHRRPLLRAPIANLAPMIGEESGPLADLEVFHAYLEELRCVGSFASRPVLRGPPREIIDGRHRLFAAYEHARDHEDFTVEVFAPAPGLKPPTRPGPPKQGQ